MPREGNPQSRRKPHSKEKRNTEANDEAHPRNKGQVKAPDPRPQPEGTETKSKSNPSIKIKGEWKTHLTQRVTPSRRNTNETKRLSLRSDRVEETNTYTRPSPG